MKVLLSWLRDFAPFEGDPVALGEEMSDLGMAVEALERIGEGLDGVVVAVVRAVFSESKRKDVRTHATGKSLRVDLISVHLVAAGFQNEVSDTQSVTGIAKACAPVQKRTAGHSRNIPLLSNHRFQTICD